MPHKQQSKARAAIASAPWAILQESLDLIIDVADRHYSNPDLAQAIRESRGNRQDSYRSRCAAVIPVFGPIFPRASGFEEVSGATSISQLSAQFRAALDDRDVDHIILNIDSPGGQVTGVHEFARFVRASCSRKPVTAYVSGIAASAAYWIACAADRIVADRTAKVGSIGVMTLWTDDSAARKAQGLRDYTFVSSQSPNKVLDPKSSAGRKEIQEQVDALAEIFIGEVAEFRGVPAAMVAETYGQGSMFLAEAAISNGMIDQIAVLDAVLAADPLDQPQSSHMEGIVMPKTVHTAGATAPGKNRSRATKPDDEEDEAAVDPAEKEEDEDDADQNAETPEGDDDDEETEGKAKARARAKMKAAYPDVYQAAYRAGIEAERARLHSIRELGLVGHKGLVERAMFDTPMSAGELAIAYAKAESGARKAMAKGRVEESASVNVPAVAVTSGLSTGSAAEEQAIINAIAGVKA